MCILLSKAGWLINACRKLNVAIALVVLVLNLGISTCAKALIIKTIANGLQPWRTRFEYFVWLQFITFY